MSLGHQTGKGSHTRSQPRGHHQAGHWATQTSPPPPPVTVVCADQLIEQYQALGIARTEAVRLLQLSGSALTLALADIDACAYATAPLTEQISMLLPRLDIDKLAQLIGISTAQVQSAVAMLALEYVLQAHSPA